jgi:hypothetical protein
MRDARPQAAFQHGLLRNENDDRPREPPGEIVGSKLAAASSNDAHDPIDHTEGQIQRDQCQSGEDNFLNGGEH